MGSSPYFYFTEYDADIDAALQVLRRREFEAGRYDPTYYETTGRFMSQFDFPPTKSSPAPGPQHATVDDALEASMEDGTSSILDIQAVGPPPAQDSDDPFAGFLTVWPLSNEALDVLFGTTKPSREILSNVLLSDHRKMDARIHEHFWGAIARGTGRYIVLYDDEMPVEIFFVEYSVD